MKYTLSKLALLTSTILFATSTFADVPADATASWQVSAKKDTTSSLVVTAMEPVELQYDEGSESFNTKNAIFGVTIAGQSGATDFELKSRISKNTLKRLNHPSTLDVGVAWNGEKLNKTTDITLIDTSKNINAGLESLANGYAGPGRVSAENSFKFSIDSATSDGAATSDLKDLPDGTWDGEVVVLFSANWTTP